MERIPAPHLNKQTNRDGYFNNYHYLKLISCLVVVSFFRYHKMVIEDARKLTDDTTETTENNDVLNA